jgi:mono/diheme cytochrome c family protein
MLVMQRRFFLIVGGWFAGMAMWLGGPASVSLRGQEPLFADPIDVRVPHISTDATVRYDYDIVYVRAHRAGDEVHKRFYTDIATPVTMEPGADLMLLHPDGSEELLVAGGKGAVTDPVISFDGQWVFYTLIHNLEGAGPWSMPRDGADLYKLHLKTRQIVRLTEQTFTPNTGAADWSSDFRTAESGKTNLNYGVLNFGAFPLPGNRLVFTSNRDAFRPPRGYPQIALQLFVMDDDGRNVEKIGHLNLAGALHPVVLTDGRIIFSSLESQGIRGEILWGIWSINPDGTEWGPVVSAFDPGGAPNAFHFQTQLSDGSLVIEEYYNQNNSGFGAYLKLPLNPPAGMPGFGPAYMNDPRNAPWRYGRHDNGKGRFYRMPFMPVGSVSMTPFTHAHDGPADTSVLGDKNSPRVGKFTHPSGAPDNHLLTIYSPGPTNHQYKYLPQLDGGIYLIKNGDPIESPSQMLMIKNDPRYNEQWPRAVVPYRRIYGIDQPQQRPALANDGSRSPHLPAGTPFGLVGTSSLYKRESYPNGVVPPGSVTATYAGGNDPWRGLDPLTSHGNGMPINWHNQGGDAGLYDNSEIHAIRILAMEPTTDRRGGPKSGRLFFSHATERLRILGEIPVRKFVAASETASTGLHSTGQPLDPDGNPDTSFLAKIPADTAFTFQTLDKDGMLLNASQTWHQLRPGEIRHNCGGCHAHSQEPTRFEETWAARPDYPVWDLVNTTPLLTGKERDESKHRWDVADTSGLRSTDRGVENVEYHRDIQPILARSCVACHTARDGRKPAGNLVLDADDESIQVENKGRFPGSYLRLAVDEKGRFGHRPVGYDSWGYPQASRYIRMFQSRRSLLAWKIFGRRLDGFSNDDHPSESQPGAGDLALRGPPVDLQKFRSRWDIDFVGSAMPPPDAVAGTYRDEDGRTIRVEPLRDEDRRTIVRWIDLGCPIDFDYDPAAPDRRGYGWMCDDNRPILTISQPQPGANSTLDRIVIGAHDYGSGLDETTFTVTADCELDGMAAGENLAARFQTTSQGVWLWKLTRPQARLAQATLTVSISDHQGNVSRVVRTCSVGGVADSR